jgi:preprotein translocase subunit SecG
VVLTYLVIAVFVVSAVLMLVLVLLHSGRGGGLSDMFGGGLNSTAAGSTVVERNLNRITIIAALVFMFTGIALGIRMQ